MTPDMTCAECREHLLEFVTGTLPHELHQRVAAHTATCSHCRREAEMWRTVRETIADTERHIPSGPPIAGGWAALRSEMAATANPSHRTLRAGVTELANERTHMRSRRTSQRTRVLDEAGMWGDPEPERRELPRQPRWQPVAAVAAVLMLGLVAAIIFSTFGASPGKRMGTSPTQLCATSQLKATLPAHASVASISMTSATDGWAVGDIFDTQHETTPPQTLLLHFHDCTWSPAGEAIPSAQLYQVAMTSPDEGWAAGATSKLLTIPQTNGRTTYMWEADSAFLLHYTAGQWQRVTLPGVTSIIDVLALRMVSPDEGWLLLDHGKTHTDPYTSAYTYSLLHYQGRTWSDIPLRFKAPTTILWALAATSPDDCWLAGYGTSVADSGGLIAHYANGTWTTWNGTIGATRTYTYYTIAMASPHDVWALGSPTLHFNGTTWSPVAIPTAPPPAGPSDIMSATMISPSEGWAFPGANPTPTASGLPALHYTNGEWQWEYVKIASAETVASLSSLTMASPTQGWALGEVYERTSFGAMTRGILLSYDAGTWRVVGGE